MQSRSDTHHLFHLCPLEIVGDALYPLNEIKIIAPNVYKKQSEKYKGREKDMLRKIPLLDCLWNDVVHFSPVCPEQIRDSLLSVGFQWRPRRWIKVSSLDSGFAGNDTVIWRYPESHSSGENIDLEDVERFDAENVQRYSVLPKATASYYGKAFANKIKPLVFMYVPHILHRGSVSLEKFQVIEI